jgi:hypothetical protein
MSWQYKKNMRFRYLGAASVVIFLCGIVWFTGRALIRSIYEGRSVDILNTLISGQSEHPLDAYYSAFDHLALLACLFIAAPVVLGLLFWGVAPAPVRQNTTAHLREFTAVVRRNWQLIYFAAASLFIVFSLGMAVGALQLFPYKTLEEAGDAAQDWAEYWRHNLRIRPDQYLKASRFEGQGVVLHNSQKAYKGVTFLTSLFDGKLGMRLVDMNGAEIHKWQVPLQDIWLEDESKRPHDWDSEIHGALLYPNGDVVFNIEHQALVKIDKCSNLLWKNTNLDPHHSVYEDKEGNLWVPGRRWRNESLDKLPYISSPFLEEYILKFSPDGELLKKVSIIDVIYGSKYEAVMFADRDFKVEHTGREITHINDIEVLDQSMSDAFELFDTGDILVSMRDLNLLVVIDPELEKIKWSMTGPYLRQHDPDFLPTGRISVYDNRQTHVDGNVFSRILELDPVTQNVYVLYEGDDENPFFSGIMGKQQHLLNGNILITETMGGRAFEVTVEGEVVWSYVNRWDSERVIAISEATRYPLSYALFDEGRCE